MKTLWLIPCALLGAALGAMFGQVLAVYVFPQWMPWGVSSHAFYTVSYFRQGFLLGAMTVLGAVAGVILPLWWVKSREKQQVDKSMASAQGDNTVWPPPPTAPV